VELSQVFISGWGAVSPAGWGMAAFRDALAKGELPQKRSLARPGKDRPIEVLHVPPANPRPAFMAHARLRRASSISHFAMGAALEAWEHGQGTDQKTVGVIVCIFSGCVHYSRRFYDETLKNPATASPLLFPETVFNSPASHISAYLGSTAINYTLVGDCGTFLQGLALGAGWLAENKVSECLVVGTEELDWLTAEATQLFDKSIVPSEGAGALLLRREKTGVELKSVTDEFLYARGEKNEALRKMKAELCSRHDNDGILIDSLSGRNKISRAEDALWQDWRRDRLSPKKTLGEGLMAGAAWQCVAGADALNMGVAENALISVAGFHQHAIGAQFCKSL
jgi:hypothetical protein